MTLGEPMTEELTKQRVVELANHSSIIYACLNTHIYGQSTFEEFLILAVIKLHEQNQELTKIAEELGTIRPPSTLMLPENYDSTL
jgi:tetrahydromethanopterin S-methyltransferase subunit B